MRSVLARVATVYVAGDDVKDARRVADTWARRGIPATFGFWDDSRDTPRNVANQYLLGLDELRPEEYLSIKLTALDYSEALLEELAARAAKRQIRLHFDAMYPDTVDRTRERVIVFAARWGSKFPIGFTLPGRWPRSLGDATGPRSCGSRCASSRDSSPHSPRRIRSRASTASSRRWPARPRMWRSPPMTLSSASGRCASSRRRAPAANWSFSTGYPCASRFRAADVLGEKVRVYVGYGRAHVPYAVSKVMKNPKQMV